jgi:hypothetical protein
MLAKLRPPFTYANVMSTIAAVAAFGGGAYAVGATIPGPNGVIKACYRTNGKSKGTLRVIPAETHCGKNETSLSWNQRGPAGSPGSPGATHVVVRTATTTINGSGGGGMPVQCAPGERATGGGLDTGTSNAGDAVVRSFPTNKVEGPATAGQTPVGWTAALQFTNGGGRTLTNYVICVSP